MEITVLVDRQEGEPVAVYEGHKTITDAVERYLKHSGDWTQPGYYANQLTGEDYHRAEEYNKPDGYKVYHFPDEHLQTGGAMPTTPAPEPEPGQPWTMTNNQLAEALRQSAHDEPRPERPELMRRAAERLEKIHPVDAIKYWGSIPLSHQSQDKHPELEALLPNVDAHNTPEEFKKLRSDFQRIARTFTHLAEYAGNKQSAAVCRLGGEINAAQEYERIAETIYNLLPDWAKW